MDSSSNIMGICFIGSLEIRRLARRMGRGLRGYGLWLQLRYLFRAHLKLLLHRMDMVDISRLRLSQSILVDAPSSLYLLAVGQLWCGSIGTQPQTPG